MPFRDDETHAPGIAALDPLVRFGEPFAALDAGRRMFGDRAPLRLAASVLEATVTAIVEAPCPAVEASCSHETSLRADHVQSRAALIVRKVEVASAGTVAGSAVTEASQRSPPGALISVTAVEPQALTTTPAAMSGKTHNERVMYG